MSQFAAGVWAAGAWHERFLKPDALYMVQYMQFQPRFIALFKHARDGVEHSFGHCRAFFYHKIIILLV